MDIQLNNIAFSYDQTSVIKGIDCAFESGNFYAVIGPNGSGKTTLLDLISGFISPSSGTVAINEKSCGDYSKKELSRLISLVSQDYAVNFPFQVKEVVMMGRHPYIQRFSHPSELDYELVELAMTQCGIRHLKNKKISELSGGEKQRTVFARALCQDTPIMLLDEAFSNMDICHTLQILEQVKHQVKTKDKLVISVFHDLNLASTWSDHLLLLKQGTLHTFGKSQDVLTRETIKDVFDVDSIVTFNPDINAKQVSYPPI